MTRAKIPRGKAGNFILPHSTTSVVNQAARGGGHVTGSGSSAELPRKVMINCAVPILAVLHSAKAEDYYCRVLGFQKTFAYRPDPTRSDPCYFGVARDGVSLHLDSFKPERAGMTGAFLQVSDVDLLYSEISARGAICQLPPTDQTWGNRETHIQDPDGNVLCFANVP